LANVLEEEYRNIYTKALLLIEVIFQNDLTWNIESGGKLKKPKTWDKNLGLQPCLKGGCMGCVVKHSKNLM